MHSTKRENLTLKNSQNVLKYWFLATRPKTWIASISPVLIGTSLAYSISFDFSFFLLTLLFSLCIQIGTNFANDYFDFMKGADTKERQGPKRAVEQGWISPHAMKKGTILLFVTAFVLGIPLMVKTGWGGLFLSLLAILSGILYTGGPKPFGYLGLGEVFVLFFFGPIATIGTYYVQTGNWNPSIFLFSLSPGLLSSAILVANNLRDEITDRKANKNTLIVRFGQAFGKWEYALFVSLALLIPLLMQTPPLSLIFLFFAACPLIYKCTQGKTALDFIPLLPQTSFLLFVYTALFCYASLCKSAH